MYMYVCSYIPLLLLPGRDATRSDAPAVCANGNAPQVCSDLRLRVALYVGQAQLYHQHRDDAYHSDDVIRRLTTYIDADPCHSDCAEVLRDRDGDNVPLARFQLKGACVRACVICVQIECNTDFK